MKKTIKNLAVAMVCSGAVMGAQSVLAGATTHDLYLGFQNSAGAGKADYIINLGLETGIVGGTTVVNLSSDFSFANFTSTGASGLQGTNAADIQGGVIGGYGLGNPGATYVTQLRSGLGTPSVAGSTAPGGLTKNQDANAWSGGTANIASPASGTGVLDTSLSWENFIDPTLNSGTFQGVTGIDPDTTIKTNSTVYEDLWFSQSSGGVAAFVYEGYFTFTMGTSSGSITFTPKNVVVGLTSPQIQSIQVNNTAATVIWTTVPSHTYQLQYDLDLNTSNWVNVGSSQMATSSTLTNTDSSATQSLKFYRVTGQ